MSRKNIIFRVGRAVKEIAMGIDSALDVCTWRVKGPEGVRDRDEVALGYLYQGFRNAKDVLRDYDSVNNLRKALDECLGPRRYISIGRGPDTLEIVT
jgi:hypothetical protein